MTTPEEWLAAAGTAEPGSEHDPELAETYAESVGIDPSHHEINTYLKMAGAPPLADQSDTAQADDVGG